MNAEYFIKIDKIPNTICINSNQDLLPRPFQTHNRKTFRLKDATKCAKEEGRKNEGDGLLRQRVTWSITAVFENGEEEAQSGSPNDPKNLKNIL